MMRSLLLPVAITVAGCASNPEADSPPWHEIEISFEPVGRFVRTDRDYGYRASAIETEDGLIYLFDQDLRSPHSPVGPLPIDCDETKQIGVWLTPGPERKKKRTLYRHVDIYAKEPRVDVQWSHSERPEGDTRYHWKQGVSFGYRWTSRLNLTREDRVDGVMTINILKGDEVLYSTSFQLMGCGLR